MTDRLRRMADLTLIEAIPDDDRPLSQCEMAPVGGGIRLYYRPITNVDRGGFHWKAVRWCMGTGAPGREQWSPEDEVEVVCHGTAYFDGIRHMYWGDGGYLYYLGARDLLALAKGLEVLEARFCSEQFR